MTASRETSWLEFRDAVIVAARRVIRLQERRCRMPRYVVPFFALADLAAAVADLDEEEGRT